MWIKGQAAKDPGHVTCSWSCGSFLLNWMVPVKPPGFGLPLLVVTSVILMFPWR